MSNKRKLKNQHLAQFITPEMRAIRDEMDAVRAESKKLRAEFDRRIAAGESLKP